MNCDLSLIDAHIHLDQYDEATRSLVTEQSIVSDWISVSTDLRSAKRTLALARSDRRIHPAFGWHPEQPLLSEEAHEQLLRWIDRHHLSMVAVGEVGLPYYYCQQETVDEALYEERLEPFIERASRYDVPVILHGVYEDVPTICQLVEKHSVRRAHFHWYKGDERSTDRILSNGHVVSVTPDILYKERTRELVKRVPLEQLLIETDGPWPYEGPLRGEATLPYLLMDVVRTIAQLKRLPEEEVAARITRTTRRFYDL